MLTDAVAPPRSLKPLTSASIAAFAAGAERLDCTVTAPPVCVTGPEEAEVAHALRNGPMVRPARPAFRRNRRLLISLRRDMRTRLRRAVTTVKMY